MVRVLLSEAEEEEEHRFSGFSSSEDDAEEADYSISMPAMTMSSPRRTRSTSNNRSGTATSPNLTPAVSAELLTGTARASRSQRTKSSVSNGHSHSTIQGTLRRLRFKRDRECSKSPSAEKLNDSLESKAESESAEEQVEEKQIEEEKSLGPVRRSTRTTRYPPNDNDSWILGGGAEARGYPSRRSRRNIQQANLEEDKEDEADEDEDYVIPEVNNGAQEEEEDDDGNETEEDEEEGHDSSDDLYTRVKGPTRRCRRIVNYRESQKSEKCEEPVSKRLRRTVKKYQAMSPEKRNLSRFKRSLSKRRRRGRRVNNDSDDSSSSSSSDSDGDVGQPKKRIKMSKFDMLFEMNGGKSKNGLAGDLQPLALDSSIDFSCVGGLELQIDKLKEMVIFPITYKDFFKARNITPPRGILFHGPPGTGKTLLARALATETSKIGGKEVSFFMRKGADILNKWIGESERQLKLLFEEASRKQPSIIFFDEIDGLAPVRSSKTDQVHNSIVSTLLAEMDGLKDRGDVIVIGATNRVDSLDPALRRPGRFDHEYQFMLPSFAARRDILKVNVSAWKNNPVPDELLEDLALLGVGFSGADLKLLCSEASMCALRRHYPQIYTTNQKLILNYNSVKVERRDWDQALTIVCRSTDRSVYSPAFTALPLPTALIPLFSEFVSCLQKHLASTFPINSPVYKEPSPKTFWLHTDCPEALEHVIPAVLYSFDAAIPIHVLSVRSMAMKGTGGEAVAVLFAEATRRPSPAVIYMPSLDYVYEYLSTEARIILQCELKKIVCHPVLIMASVRDSLPDELREFFENHEPAMLKKPSVRKRKEFFKQVFNLAQEIRPPYEPSHIQETLVLAPIEPKRLSEEELNRIEKSENQILRELRIFLREIIFKLVRNKRFTEFTKPVDLEEVPDYLEIISTPMDLETMMVKVNQGNYHSAREFLDDIRLIKENALNYNPAKTDTDLRIRHRAYELMDFAETHIDLEMDSDFEDVCLKIVEARKKRKEDMVKPRLARVQALRPPPKTPENPKEQATPSSSGVRKRRSKSAWCRGVVKKPAKKQGSDDAKLQKSEADEILMDSEDMPLISDEPNVSEEVHPQPEVAENTCAKTFGKLHDMAAQISDKFSIRKLLELRFQLLILVDQHAEAQDKTELYEAMKALLSDWKNGALPTSPV